MISLSKWIVAAMLLSPLIALSQGSPLPKGVPIPVTAPDGVKIATYEWGNPSGPELVFIHGFSQSYLAFSKQISSDLAKDYRIIAFDLRGHGESDKPMALNAYTEGKRWADDVAAVIQAAGLKRPYLIGWSMGGRVISQYLDVYGDAALAGVVFVSSRTAVTPTRTFLGPGAATLGQMQVTANDDNIRATTQFLRACFELQPSADEFAYLLAYNMLTPPHARKGAQLWPGKFDDALKRVKVPTLVIHGTKDKIIVKEAAEFTTSLISGSKLVWIDGAGHSPFWEMSDMFNTAIRSFAH